ncbi:hypothetical protein C4577_06805 [Candidatus Parcubacteria bacterium]|nr:MAG: hypothetical protein C4577_06805 [Candidatus Parcubacteria bacterium]
MNEFEGTTTTMTNVQSTGANFSQGTYGSGRESSTAPEESIVAPPVRSGIRSSGQREKGNFADKVIERVSERGVGGAFDALARGEFGRQVRENRDGKEVSGVEPQVLLGRWRGNDLDSSQVDRRKGLNPREEESLGPGRDLREGGALEGGFDLDKERVGIIDEVPEGDPLYQQIVGEIVLKKQKTGEGIDMDEVASEAKREYQFRKEDPDNAHSGEEMRTKEELEAKAAENTPLAERVKALENELAYVKYMNVELLKIVEQLLKILEKKKELEDKDKPSLVKVLINLISLLLSAVSTGDDDEREKKAREVEEKINKAFAGEESYDNGKVGKEPVVTADKTFVKQN